MSGAIAVVGEAIVDLISDTGDTYLAVPGGSPLNVAVSSARLGEPTYFAGRFAPDRFGQLLFQHAQTHGVNLTLSTQSSDGATGLAIASLDEHGNADYAFYLDTAPDWGWQLDTLPAPPDDVVIVHAGSLATTMGSTADVLYRFCAALRVADAVVVSYDANVRPSLVGDRDAAAKLVERFGAVAHLAKASVEDLSFLWPGDTADDVARRWLASGSDCVVVTDGANGARVHTRGGSVDVAAYEVDVVDTVGAGDAFTAAFLTSLAGRDDLVAEWDGMCAQPPDGSFGPAARRAVATAALTCARAGALGPSAGEVDNFIRNRGDDVSWQA